MIYNVTYTQYWTYFVDATTVDDAESLAYRKFEADMLRPIAHTDYDDVEIDPDYDEADLDDDDSAE